MTYSIDKEATFGALGIYEEGLVSSMRKYGWRLRESKVSKENAPHMYVNVSVSRDPAALLPAVITGATLYVVPSWATSDYKVTAQVVDPKDNEYFYKERDEVVLVQWLPMVLAFPFANPFSAEEETIERMYENIAFKLNEEYPVK